MASIKSLSMETAVELLNLKKVAIEHQKINDISKTLPSFSSKLKILIYLKYSRHLDIE
ncbi:hypothetical protein [Viridibacillus arvi]|uniref:hypothetical protein n=1 Tax=Viridibacillus arvi TaxID=263475 RepID=UPI00187B9630|nr:hypothetical protein [Viridibacillus sp. JNUCC-6]QOV11618.1 hypothetical protein JNUCC6_02210 [Viridibacillus sp. JNUCC-6]